VAISLYNQTTQMLEMRAEQHFETLSFNSNEIITEETHTLAYRAWAAQAMRQTDDINQETDVAHPQRSSLNSVIDLVIQGRSGLLGVLEVGSQQTAAFTDTEITILIQIASQLGVALANVATYLLSSRRATMKALTNDISGRIQHQTDMEGLMQVTVEELSKALNAGKARIRLGVDAPTIMQKDA
jgi:GAF domain-containing protein